jgi:hypothetical protein
MGNLKQLAKQRLIEEKNRGMTGITSTMGLKYA